MAPSVFPAPSPSDSGLRLESLARICMSLSRRPLPDAGWGAAGGDSFARFSSALFRAMSGKVASGDDLACRCRLAVSLHALMRETDYVADARRYADWEALAARVLDDCEASVSVGLVDLRGCKDTTVFDICKLFGKKNSKKILYPYNKLNINTNLKNTPPAQKKLESKNPNSARIHYPRQGNRSRPLRQHALYRPKPRH